MTRVDNRRCYSAQMRFGFLFLLLSVCAASCDNELFTDEAPLVPVGDSAWVWQLEFPHNTDLAVAARVLDERFIAAGVDDVSIELRPPSQLMLYLNCVPEEGKEFLLRLATMQGRVGFHRVDESSRTLEDAYEELGSTEKDVIQEIRNSNLGTVLVSADGPRLAEAIEGIARQGTDLAGRSIAIQPPNESGRDGPRFTAYVVLTKPELNNADIASATWRQSTDVPTVDITFTDSGAEHFAALTREHLGGRVAILLDDTVLSAPVIRQVIEQAPVQLRFGWGGPPEEVELMARVWAFLIELQPLPAAATVVAETSVDIRGD